MLQRFPKNYRCSKCLKQGHLTIECQQETVYFLSLGDESKRGQYHNGAVNTINSQVSNNTSENSVANSGIQVSNFKRQNSSGWINGSNSAHNSNLSNSGATQMQFNNKKRTGPIQQHHSLQNIQENSQILKNISQQTSDLSHNQQLNTGQQVPISVYSVNQNHQQQAALGEEIKDQKNNAGY